MIFDMLLFFDRMLFSTLELQMPFGKKRNDIKTFVSSEKHSPSLN